MISPYYTPLLIKSENKRGRRGRYKNSNILLLVGDKFIRSDVNFMITSYKWPFEVIPEIITWLHKNTISFWKITYDVDLKRYLMTTTDHMVFLYFDNDEDVVNFKLTWM